MESRKFFLKQGPLKKDCGSFELRMNWGKLKGATLFSLLRSALRREAHFRAYPVTGMALYDSSGRMVVPKQLQPKQDDPFVQEVKFLYLDLFSRSGRLLHKSK